MSRPLIRDPEAVPIVGVDAHLPAVPAERLRPESLRERFLCPPVWEPETRGDGTVFTARTPASAAVLMPLVLREEGVQVLLTRRTAHLRSHAGQISFPGGATESTDGSPAATALRETEEEIGLTRAKVEIIGTLTEYVTVTAFHVTPVVALVTPPFELQLDAFEVAQAFEVPLAFLMDPAHHRRHRFDFESEGAQHSRTFLSMPWDGHFIWGATAAMLRNLYRFLSA
ncbi:MAG: CoA pyrophosphatase [Paucibacter sp.]|nr:CoA pyrophosphatase [Roseateles sp.]